MFVYVYKMLKGTSAKKLCNLLGRKKFGNRKFYSNTYSEIFWVPDINFVDWKPKMEQ